jgi:hypothetical protein
MDSLDDFYSKFDEPILSCLLALKKIILSQDPEILSEWKYGMPFFTFRKKMFCYLWVHKKHKQPYLGIVEGKQIEHPDLILEKRAKMKIMLFDSNEDLPIETIENILQKALEFYKNKEK